MKLEDDLNIFFKTWMTTFKKMKMEDDLNNFFKSKTVLIFWHVNTTSIFY